MTAKFDHELVETLCKNRGLSYTQLAGLVGVTEAAVRQWVNGKVAPGFVLGMKLADALKVDPHKLITYAA